MSKKHRSVAKPFPLIPGVILPTAELSDLPEISALARTSKSTRSYLSRLMDRCATETKQGSLCKDLKVSHEDPWFRCRYYCASQERKTILDQYNADPNLGVEFRFFVGHMPMRILIQNQKAREKKVEEFTVLYQTFINEDDSDELMALWAHLISEYNQGKELERLIDEAFGDEEKYWVYRPLTIQTWKEKIEPLLQNTIKDVKASNTLTSVLIKLADSDGRLPIHDIHPLDSTYAGVKEENWRPDDWISLSELSHKHYTQEDFIMETTTVPQAIKNAFILIDALNVPFYAGEADEDLRDYYEQQEC